MQKYAVMSLGLAAAAAMALTTMPSLAQSDSAKRWSGVSVGAFVGWSRADTDLSLSGASQAFPANGIYINDGTGGTTPDTNGNEPNSQLLSPLSDVARALAGNSAASAFTGGASLGVNQQYGAFVIGIETDIARLSTSGSATLAGTTNAVYAGAGAPPFGEVYQSLSAVRNETWTGSARTLWDASVRLRAGFLVRPSLLVYGTGGLALGKVAGGFSYSANTVFTQEPTGGALALPGTITHTTSGAASINETRVGWTVGGGLELDIGQGWHLRGEYRYIDLGNVSRQMALSRTTSDARLQNGGPSSATASASTDIHTVRVGLSYNF